MGRPLNKKYFGNRNIGTNGYETTQHGDAQDNGAQDGDDHIGGEGFANVLFSPAPVVNSVYTSGAYLDKMPHITSIGAPTIANGVQAIADVTNVQAVFAVPNARGTGYKIGDIIEGTTGTGTKARFKVTKLRVLDVTISNQPASSAFDGGENLVWDAGVDSHWTTPTILTSVVSTGSPNYDLGSGPHPYNTGASTYGVWDGTDGTPAPTSLTITGGNNTPNPTNPSYNTRGNGDLHGHTGTPNVDNNGAGGTANFTYGIQAVEVVSGFQGDYTAVDAAAQAVANITVGATGANATLDIFYGVKTVTTTQKGSGYTGAETVTFTAADVGLNETRATGTMVITTDSGAVGSATNQENAIIAFAYIDGQEEVDIVKQISTDRYRVNSNATGNQDRGEVIAKLKVDGLPTGEFIVDGVFQGTEMNIWAFDSHNGSYLVKKLTARKAVVYPFACARLGYSAGTEFALNDDGSAQQVPWSFDSAVNGYSVKIENA